MNFADKLGHRILCEALAPVLPPEERAEIVDTIVDTIYVHREEAKDLARAEEMMDAFKKGGHWVAATTKVEGIEETVTIGVEVLDTDINTDDNKGWSATGQYVYPTEDYKPLIVIEIAGMNNPEPRSMEAFKDHLDDVLVHELTHFSRDFLTDGRTRDIPYIAPKRDGQSDIKYSRQPIETDAYLATLIYKFKEKPEDVRQKAIAGGVREIVNLLDPNDTQIYDFDTPKWRAKVMKKFHREGIPVRKW